MRRTLDDTGKSAHEGWHITQNIEITKEVVGGNRKGKNTKCSKFALQCVEKSLV